MALSYRVTIMPHVSVEVDAFRYLHPFRTQTATTGSIGTGQLAAGLYTDPTPLFWRNPQNGSPRPVPVRILSASVARTDRPPELWRTEHGTPPLPRSHG